MRAPSTKRLMEAFDLTRNQARIIRDLAHAVDDGGLADLVEGNPLLDATDSYVRSLYSDPYRSDCWRVTVALHGIDEIVGGFGVECFGPERSGDFAPAYEYINFGDTYGTTLIYRRAGSLFIGDWGSIMERMHYA